jgi:vitamin K-dependent gamma-carboxylase
MKSRHYFSSKLHELLFERHDIAGLAVVRMLFGIIIMYESFRYADFLRIVSQYSPEQFHFKYRFFEWIEPLSPVGMKYVFFLYGLTGLGIFLGTFYRLATLLSALCMSYIFLCESTNYLNHFYLVIIFSFMMFFIPAHKGWSLHALLRPKQAENTVAGWAIWLIRCQLVIVYSYAAFAKMNVDWINGMPLYNWIGKRAADTGFEAFLALPITIYIFTYGGMIYDLIIAPLLLYKPSRAFAYCLTIMFHLTNYYLFNIGIFPWFMLATTTIFFDTNWPRSFLNFFWEKRFQPISTNYELPKKLNYLQKLGVSAFIVHVLFQAGFPLRHFFYPNYVSWSEEGHNFSWHMKLRSKSGTAKFIVKDPTTGAQELILPERYLSKRQISKMVTRPYLILQFAHYLRDKFTKPGEVPVEVYAETSIRLNGRKAQRMIDPDVDLSAVEIKETGNDWVLPLRQTVWNASLKQNRFGPAFVKDKIAMKAIQKYDKETGRVADAR